MNVLDVINKLGNRMHSKINKLLKFNYKCLYLMFVMMFMLPVESTFADIDNISSAINKAGRQRMLSQRIVATYSQVGMDIQKKKSKSQLKESINLFEKQLIELKNYRSYGPVNKQLKLVEELWQPMINILNRPVSKAEVIELRKQAEEVLAASHRVVLMLEKESGTKASELVNLSGRQRMLSQRISNLYMLQSWGINNGDYESDFAASLSEFRHALSELKKAAVNTPEINKKLNRARKSFSILEKSTLQREGEYIPLMVKMSADKLLIIMNDITSEYNELAKKEMAVR